MGTFILVTGASPPVDELSCSLVFILFQIVQMVESGRGLNIEHEALDEQVYYFIELS